MPDPVSDAATPVSRGARDRELEPGRGDGRLALAFDGLLLDLDGVVYIGPEVLPHVAAVLRQLRRHLPLGLVTNNAARTPHQVAAHLTERGVECAADEVDIGPAGGWPPHRAGPGRITGPGGWG